MSATFWLGVVALAVVIVGIAVLICSAHIPGLRSLTDAAPLEREPCPEPPAAEPPAITPPMPPAPRIAHRPSDIPHGTTRRQM